jgi:chromosomal replication initiation ATPase DnaA
MNDLELDLRTVCDTLYAKKGLVLTPADKPMILARVEDGMKARSGWRLCDIRVDMDDDKERVTIRVQNGLKTAETTLCWETANGYWVRVDTDGDGK